MNSNKKFILQEISLAEYGEFVNVYRGNGILSVADKAEEIPLACTFEAGQRIDGKIILLCHELPRGFSFYFRIGGEQAKKFEGKTEEGYLIRSNEAERGLNRIGYLPKSNRNDENLAFNLTELSIFYSEGKCHELHFGISNFEFDKNDSLDNGKDDKIIIPLTKEEKIEIFFKKLNDYDNKINRIWTLRGIDVTCEFILKISNKNDLNKLIELIDDICFLLSVKNGTKITWIYYEIYDKNGETISRNHTWKVTKAYQPLDIFYCCENSSIQTIKFLEDSYPYFMKYRDLLRLKRGVIDAYLDAKAEADYIETRGGKIALAIEFLKNEYLASKGENSEYIFPPQEFKKSISSISDAMVNALKLQGLSDQNKIRLISGEKKIEGLNRRSFGSIFLERSSKNFMSASLLMRLPYS